MKKSLFDFLLDKQKQKLITPVEEKVKKLYLQAYVLIQYFEISVNYSKTDKIQKEVEELYPAWTGYENYYWYTYHYEGFGNALYSYTQVYMSTLNLLRRKSKNFPKNGEILLNELIANSTIDKILKDRHDSVHQFGLWRSELTDELGIQDWKTAEFKITTTLAKANELIKTFDEKIIHFINTQMQTMTNK